MASELVYSGFSVKQPWAGLLVAGIKRFEARSWAPVELGPYFVHASSGRSPAHAHLRNDPNYLLALNEAGMTNPKDWPTGAIVGVVNIARIWLPDQERPPLSELDHLLCGEIEGLALWEMDAALRIDEPIPCKGKLNLWHTEGDLSKMLQRAVRRRARRVERETEE